MALVSNMVEKLLFCELNVGDSRKRQQFLGRYVVLLAIGFIPDESISEVHYIFC